MARAVDIGGHRAGAQRALAVGMTATLCLCMLGLALGAGNAAATTVAAPVAATGDAPRQANFKREQASADAVSLAQWVLASNNNRSLSFMIIDKKEAKAFVFDGDGQLDGATAVLLGEAVGDDSVPGIGSRKLSTIRVHERTTPAGRFVAAIDRNVSGKDILWIDYGNAVSLHRVVTSDAKERRAQRLASATSSDNRISYGCVNVPEKFFDKVVIPAFKKTNGIVYILPETRPIGAVFAAYDAAVRKARVAAAGQ
ncbi:hypothetical protein [Massilia glaciei]|uniref:L,D-transpeptidase n=1 Tax=Massilia glaciei TaxID=1524097 RepID=A0A2U2HPC3_9BURK|nr:hypothetical protein [Massilia glaciei]PWF49265.1 hypothetical protein C7C56_007470 [Massilia glaciei]